MDTVVKLAKSLEVDVTELLVGIDWEPGSVTLGSFREAGS
jgi:hypothetical protein